MTKDVQTYLIDMLLGDWDYAQAEILFLRHQQTLLPQHRKVDAEYTDIARLAFSLEQENEKREKAIKQLQAIVPNIE